MSKIANSLKRVVFPWRGGLRVFFFTSEVFLGVDLGVSFFFLGEGEVFFFSVAPNDAFRAVRFGEGEVLLFLRTGEADLVFFFFLGFSSFSFLSFSSLSLFFLFLLSLEEFRAASTTLSSIPASLQHCSKASFHCLKVLWFELIM